MHRIGSLNSERGAVAVTVAVSLMMLLSFAALAIDIGQAVVVKNELQDVADGAALAGARVLGVMYAGGPNGTPPPPMPITDQMNYTLTSGDISAVRNAVTQIGALNQAGGASMSLLTTDVQIGDWNGTTKTFTPTSFRPNAVTVMARRDGSANGPISTFLASFMGFSTINLTANATAALTAAGSSAPGEIDVPFAISDQWFTNFGCNQPIKFYPTGSAIGCAGWDTFDLGANNNVLRNTIINGMDNGSYAPPATQVGGAGTSGTLNFIGGNLGQNTFLAFAQLFNDKKDPSTGYWDVFVPVYQDAGSCSNPNQSLPIVGYATARLTNVQTAPTFEINGIVECNVVQNGMGGGGSYGTFASLPGLVQ